MSPRQGQNNPTLPYLFFEPYGLEFLVKLHFMVEVHFKVNIHQLGGPVVINTIFTAGLYSYDSKNRNKHSYSFKFLILYIALQGT